MPSLRDILAENPVIAAVRDAEDIACACRSRVKLAFVLAGRITTVGEICARLTQAGKEVFIHADLLEGLRGDAAGVEFLRGAAGARGILSTRPGVLRHAREVGFETILRIFVVDSLSLRTGIQNIRETGPDAVEVMPGVVCREITGIERQLTVPVIAGGLIVRKEQIIGSLSAGATAISTTRRELWEL